MTPILSVDSIVGKLQAANARRAEALRGYRGQRHYHLDYHGLFGSHSADIWVEASYTAPDKKNFKVLSESGSGLLINRVLLKLLSSEAEAQLDKNRKALEVTPANYEFSLDGVQHDADGDFYVLNVKPRSKSKYLYRGKIWVDAKDFAIARMSGEPDKNPSIWISSTQIEYRWAEKGEFWLPMRNRSVTHVRMGGQAVLTIDYSDYQITAADSFPKSQRSAQSVTLPAPSSVSADPP